MSKRRRFGGVRRLPSGRWQVRYYTPQGVRVTASGTFATKTEADRHLASVELSMVGGTWHDPRRGRISVTEWAEQWLASATHLKPKTAVSYESLLRCVISPSLGRVPVGDLRPAQVREWVGQLIKDGRSASRVRQAYRLLSQVMSAACLDGRTAATPCVGVRLPSMKEAEPTIVSPAQVRELVKHMSAADSVFTTTLAYTGLRFGEAAGLRRRYLRLADAKLRVALSLSDANGRLTFEQPKTHQHREVTLPALLVEELHEHLRHAPARGLDDLVFVSPEGMPMRHGNFMRRAWRPAVQAAGLQGLTPHDLRASHASWLYDQGWSPVEIAARLGHAKATVTTKHYARRIVGRDVEIASKLNAIYEEASDGLGHAEGTPNL